jgi:acyl-CoA thioester hydrolase
LTAVAPHRHRIRVRYGECDEQGVVFNAHYLAYVDDTLDTWLRMLERPYQTYGWDMMVKHAELTWHAPASVAELLDIDAEVVRWGTTSLDVRFDGAVGDRPVFTAVLTYVGVAPGTTDPVPPPDPIRRLLRATGAT